MWKGARSRRPGAVVPACFLCLGLAVLACGEVRPREAELPSSVIGVVNTAPSLELRLTGFKDGMADLGYVEGENVTYIYNGPVGSDVAGVIPVVQDLLESDVDLILSLGTPATLAAKQVTSGTDVPVVFFCNDPVAAGIVENLRHPGENLTGTRNEPADGRRLELLLQVAPRVRRIYVPYNPGDEALTNALAAVGEVASKLGVELVLREARNGDEVALATEAIPGDVDAIFLLPDTLMGSYVADWVDAALELGLPLSGPGRDQAEAGALITYGADLYAGGVQSARLADQILKGAKAGDLPIESNSTIFIINLRTAEALGLNIPREMLRQADIIIR